VLEKYMKNTFFEGLKEGLEELQKKYRTWTPYKREKMKILKEEPKQSIYIYQDNDKKNPIITICYRASCGTVYNCDIEFTIKEAKLFLASFNEVFNEAVKLKESYLPEEDED
jgi:hypothetical protein